MKITPILLKLIDTLYHEGVAKITAFIFSIFYRLANQIATITPSVFLFASPCARYALLTCRTPPASATCATDTAPSAYDKFHKTHVTLTKVASNKHHYISDKKSLLVTKSNFGIHVRRTGYDVACVSTFERSSRRLTLPRISIIN